MAIENWPVPRGITPRTHRISFNPGQRRGPFSLHPPIFAWCIPCLPNRLLTKIIPRIFFHSCAWLVRRLFMNETVSPTTTLDQVGCWFDVDRRTAGKALRDCGFRKPATRWDGARYTSSEMVALAAYFLCARHLIPVRNRVECAKAVWTLLRRGEDISLVIAPQSGTASPDFFACIIPTNVEIKADDEQPVYVYPLQKLKKTFEREIKKAQDQRKQDCFLP